MSIARPFRPALGPEPPVRPRMPLAQGLALVLACLLPPATASAQEPPGASEAARTPGVSHIRLEGVGEHADAGITPASVQAVADEALQAVGGPLPAHLTFAQIEQIAARVTAAYRDAGFLVSQTIVPPQQIGPDQVLHLQVVEGRVGRVLVQGSARYRDDQLAGSSLGLVGRPLRSRELDRALLYARDLPGVSVTSVLQPGQDPGETDIVLVARDSARPYEVSAAVSNHGTDSTGRYRADVAVNAYNALGAGDVLAASAGVGLDPNDSWQAALSLSVPSSQVDGLSGIAGVSRSEIELNSPPFAALDIHGPTTLLYFGGDWKFVQRSDLQVQASGRWINEQSRLEGLGIELSQLAFNVLDAGVTVRHTDHRWRGVNLLQASVRKSVTDNSAEQNWLYNAHDAYFWVGRLSLARLQALPANQRIVLRGSAQFTDSALTPLEQFALGGPDSVRAFPIASALGDRGVQATFEYQVEAPGFADRASPFNGRRWGDLFTLGIFYDWGRVSPGPDNRRLGVLPTTQEGAGVSLGLRLPWQPGLRLDLSLATPTGTTPAPDGDDLRAWARIGMTF